MASKPRFVVAAVGVVGASASLAMATPVTTGLTLWLDADDAANRSVDGSDNVLSWTNKAPSVNGSAPAFTTTPVSDGGTTAQETPDLVTGGLNGRDYFNFQSGVAFWENMSTTKTAADLFPNNARTFVAVVRPDLAINTGLSYTSPQVIGVNNGFFALTYRDVGGQFSWVMYNWDGSEDNATHPATLGQFAIVIGTLSAGQLDVYVNGSQGASAASGVTSDMTNTVFLGDSNFFDGGIAELMIYDQGLSVNDRQTVESYLSQKWGVALIPEPVSGGLALLGAGGAALLIRRRR